MVSTISILQVFADLWQADELCSCQKVVDVVGVSEVKSHLSKFSFLQIEDLD